ncbi:MAG TPA: DinB family protein [bacterium]|nr:DinB family protein [bacterium]
MSDALVDALKRRYRLGHQRLYKMLEGLTEQQFVWKPAPATHSIAFNAWHLARWADYLQAKIPLMAPSLERKLGPGVQIWEAEGLAEQWVLDPEALGWGQTGMEMSDEAASELALPSMPVVMDYLRRTFDAMERALEALDDEELRIPYRSPNRWEGERPVGEYIIGYAIHNDFHRGQVAYVRRLLGLTRVIA